MSWKKHFKPVNSVLPTRQGSSTGNQYAALQRYNTWLPEYYQGPANRLQRYVQYDQMDFDHEVNSALSTLAEFCTQIDEATMLPFTIKFHDEPSSSELKVVQEYLKKWCKINQFSKRIFRIFRSTLKYGDQFFIRDPETKELYWVDPANVEKIGVNESKGKVPEVYHIKNIDLNVRDKVASNNHDGQKIGNSIAFPSMPNAGGSIHQAKISGVGNSGTKATEQALPVDASHIFHISLSEGLDDAWPFGVSELEKVFKVYKQKELLEDSVLIYRIHRAPERRIFTIDVGTMPPQMAQQYLEKVKHEVQQKRIPTRTGGGNNIVDAAYNPMCFDPETNVLLCNGQIKSMVQLIDDYTQGIVNYVYSQNNEPSKIIWAGVTRKNAEVIKITLSNGKSVITTPDHKFISKTGFEIQAIDLKKYDSLMTINGDIFVNKVEKMNNKIDTCDITVDNKSHIFALDSGVFVHNSMLEDYYFTSSSDGRGSKVETLPGGENLGCFSMDTKVSLLDGRDLSIYDIEQELKDGKKLWTYSCHPISGDIAPGLISWAGKTREMTQVVKVTLDNGNSFICTPDHQFPIRGQGLKEIKDIEIGQSLIALYKENKNLSNNKKREYTTFFDHLSQKCMYTHRMVADYFIETDQYNEFLFNEKNKDLNKDVRHHVDHNRFNNNPENLSWMAWKDHQEYHRSHGFDVESQQLGTQAAKEKMIFLKENKPEEYHAILKKAKENRNKTIQSRTKEKQEEVCLNRSTGIKNFISQLSDAEKLKRAQTSRDNFKLGTEKVQTLLKTDEIFREAFKDAIKIGIEASKQIDPIKWINRSSSISKANFARWKLDDYYDKVFASQKLKFISEHLILVSHLYQNGLLNEKEICHELSNDIEFMNSFVKLNNKTHSNFQSERFTERHLKVLLKAFGLNWDTFRASNSNVIITPELQECISFYKQFNKQDVFLKNANKNDKLKKVLNLNSISQFTFDKFLKNNNMNNFGVFKGIVELNNHRIISIEYLEEKIDVGTLEIDKTEKYHDYHTFALAAGIFSSNTIDDLRYFNNKMLRALGVPSSYLPSGPEDGTDTYNNGRVGTAFIQEFRFQKTCKRLQSLIMPVFDEEFKKYLDKSGVTVENSLFELDFTEPQNFSQYRQIELDAALASVYSQVAQNPIISKRFALKRYLGWTQKEILENEQSLAEELAIKGNKTNRKTQANLRQVGLGAGDLGGGNDFQGEVAGEDELNDLGTDMSGDISPTGSEPNLSNESTPGQ